MALQFKGGKASDLSDQRVREQAIPLLVKARELVQRFNTTSPSAQAKAAATKINDAIELLGRV